MLNEFINQNYLIIQDNVVSNVCVWDGDTSQWTPPSGSIALVQSTIQANVWIPVIVDKKITDYVLQETLGAGDIGFTWDGTVLTTNESKPVIPTAPTA